MIADTIHEKMKGWFAKVILAVLVLSFALFGIDTYNKAGGNTQVLAEVGDSAIVVSEFEEHLKREQARLREAGENNPDILNSKTLKSGLLDQLIQERLLIQQVVTLGYQANEPAILSGIQQEPNFQENGRFSEARFRRFLDYNRINHKQYIASIAQGILMRDLLAFQTDTSIVSRQVTDHLLGIMAQQREVAKAIIPANTLLNQVKIDPQQIRAYYDAHPELSRIPEQARVEYVVFTPESVLANLQLTEAEVKAYYEKNIAQFALPERREVAHILIRVLPDAKPEDKQNALTKAQQLVQQTQQNPAQFAALAKQHSQDPLTAAKGGSFGEIQRGSIFPQVEQAAFSMRQGEIRGPVESPAGYHIVMVKSIAGGGQSSFEAVKDKVTEAARRDLALRKFNEQVDLFGDAVYANPSSLKPAAEKFQLKLEASEWFGRQGPAAGVLKNERLLQAIFSSDVIKDKRNTESIEVGPNKIVAARMVEYKPASHRPLDAVRDEIENRLRQEQAAKLAKQQGEALLAGLRENKPVSGVSFGPAKTVSRDEAMRGGLVEAQAIFRADANKLPSYSGVALPNGDYAIYRINNVIVDDKLQQQLKPVLSDSLRQIQAEQVAVAYLASLRNQTKVEIKQPVLDKLSER